MKIAISSGHSLYCRGAAGSPVPPYLDEVDEARKVVPKLADYLRTVGVEVTTFNDDISKTQNENLNRIVDWHNSQGPHDLDISCHFNANKTTSQPVGTECLFLTQEALAEDVASAIAEASGLKDRGPKPRSDLFFLNNTRAPAILIEVAFVDSSCDAELYRASFNDICRSIAEVIAERDIVEPDEPPAPEPEPEPVPPTGENYVEIKGGAQGDIAVVINGQMVRGKAACPNVIDMQISMHGDVSVIINGQDFHNKPTIPLNQRDIIATVFGGEDDPNCSAYDEDMMLNDIDLYVALPDKFQGERPLVRVHNRSTGESATAEIWDVGPWNTDNPYWETGERPQAESCYEAQQPLTSGPNAGQIPSNSAGIDLSPALADALGIDGKGQVDWEFVS